MRCLLSYIIFFDIDDANFDGRGEIIFAFCDTLLSLPFEGYRGELWNLVFISTSTTKYTDFDS